MYVAIITDSIKMNNYPPILTTKSISTKEEDDPQKEMFYTKNCEYDKGKAYSVTE